MTRRQQQMKTVPEPKEQPLDTVSDELALAFEQDTGTGLEEATQEDFALPFLVILQQLSPQVQEQSPKYVEGAKAGMVYNTVTGELHDVREGHNPLRLIPCHFRVNFVEWITRSDGGGYVNAYDRTEGKRLLETCVENDRGRKIVLPNGHELIDTRNHFVLVVNADMEITPAMIAMVSTQSSVSRNWMAQIQMFRGKVRNNEGTIIKTVAPKSYGQIWPLTTYLETKDNYTWYKWRVGNGEIVPSIDLFNEGKAFHEAVKSGDVKIDLSQQDISEPSEDFVEEDKF